MKYRLFFIDQPHAVDVYLMKNLGLDYSEYEMHPLREYDQYSCVTLDEQQGLVLKLMFNNAELIPIEE